ncbi:MAG: zf-HC2 domain-containing protein [Thermodesulfobacteriota bacterium]
MECEKIREQFSSLLEKELSPLEEKEVGDHLASCSECQKELERFEKTMEWLHSMEEVEVPEGFLSGVYKTMEERENKASVGEKARWRWLSYPLSLRLPIQAVAMVTIVFLALYLTKMMPVETFRLKEAQQKSLPPTVEKKMEQVVVPKEMEKERRAMEAPSEIPRPKDVEQAKGPALAERKDEGAYVAQVNEEAKKVEAPPPKAEIMAYQTIESKETARAKVPSPEPGKIEKGWVAKEKSMVASKPPQEIILRISNREKTLSQLRGLVKQFGGEILTAEGNILQASLPIGSFSEFEKELVGLSSSTKADKVIAQKYALGGLRASPGVKEEEVDEKNKESARRAIDEGRTVVRILLIQE